MPTVDSRFAVPPPGHRCVWPTVPDAEPGRVRVERSRHDYLEPLHEPSYGVAMPSVIEAHDGAVIAIWYGGTVSWGKSYDPHEKDGCVYLCRLTPGAAEWTPKQVLDQEPEQAHASTFMFKNAAGRIFAGYTLFDEEYDFNYGHSRLRIRASDDDGRSWTPARDLPHGDSVRAATNGVLLPNGNTCLGVTLENTPGKPELHFGVCACLISRDGGENWDMSGIVQADDGTYLREPSLVLYPDGTLRMFMRSSLPGHEWSGGGPENPIYVWESRSDDGGWTWADPTPTRIVNNESTVDIVRLPAGELVMAHNDTPYADWQKRWPLDLALSADDGATWAKIGRIDPGPGYVCHPSVDVGADGALHVVYTCVYRVIRYVRYRIDVAPAP